MVQTDNGSEFMKCFDKACDQMNIEHTFSYVKCPKMNSYVESYNGYIQRECLLKKDAISNLNILNCKIMEYLIIYNTFRPHGSLDYKTPLEVYSQYWNNSTKLHKEMWTHTRLLFRLLILILQSNIKVQLFLIYGNFFSYSG